VSAPGPEGFKPRRGASVTCMTPRRPRFSLFDCVLFLPLHMSFRMGAMYVCSLTSTVSAGCRMQLTLFLFASDPAIGIVVSRSVVPRPLISW